jgi:toxin-antitoxin system PIN domain toxin
VILPDVNVLLYAFRSDSQEHRQHQEWLTATVEGGATYGMAPQVLSSMIRVVTNRKIFADTYRLDEAVAFANTLLDQPNCQIIQPGERHWRIFCDLCFKAKARGDLVQDAWFAALAIEAGCEWITLDRDYARFPGLRWRTPF